MTDLKEIQYSLEAHAKELLRLSEKVEKAAVAFDKATNVAIAKDFFEAETKVKELTRELESLKETYKTSLEARDGQSRMLSQIRVNLNGEGRNPLVDHAFDVFQALKEASPDHYLVTRVQGDSPHRASLTKTEAEFLYACLDFCANEMGNMTCNDWIIKKPTPAVLAFSKSVARWEADDQGEEYEPTKSKSVEGNNASVPYYLMNLLRRVYGEDLKKCSAESLGLL